MQKCLKIKFLCLLCPYNRNQIAHESNNLSLWNSFLVHKAWSVMIKEKILLIVYNHCTKQVCGLLVWEIISIKYYQENEL